MITFFPVVFIDISIYPLRSGTGISQHWVLAWDYISSKVVRYICLFLSNSLLNMFLLWLLFLFKPPPPSSPSSFLLHSATTPFWLDSIPKQLYYPQILYLSTTSLHSSPSTTFHYVISTTSPSTTFLSTSSSTISILTTLPFTTITMTPRRWISTLTRCRGFPTKRDPGDPAETTPQEDRNTADHRSYD